METFLIVGLGNPDRKYENTRHNTGFICVDCLAEKMGVTIAERKFNGLMALTYKDGKKFILLKPQTYMNLSGQSVMPAAAYYDIPADHIVIIYDDINLDPGRIRVRPYGSAGGHNGMKSIISELQTDRFPRVRVGVGLNERDTPEGEKVRTDLAAHVLAKFTPEERKVMDGIFARAADAALAVCTDGPEQAMNLYNC